MRDYDLLTIMIHRKEISIGSGCSIMYIKINITVRPCNKADLLTKIVLKYLLTI